MAGTRSSARLANQDTSPKPDKSNGKESSPKENAGDKRKAGSKQNTPKKSQKTLEETIPGNEQDDLNDIEMQEAAESAGTEKPGQKAEEKKDDEDQSTNKKDSEEKPAASTSDKNDKESKPADSGADQGSKDVKPEDNKAETSNGEPNETLAEASNVKPQARENEAPSNVLEKGIIYFFSRGRVGIEDPESPADLQRTYFVLRPLPTGAKVTDGALEDSKNNRLFALPKKVFPKSHNDRFMAFVEKGDTTIQELKDTFFKGEQYETATSGSRTTPPVTPIGEGVYSFTQTQNTTHLVYMLTIPQQLGEVQTDLGLNTQGSFVVSVKNPQRKGPANASLPQGPGFPQEILDEFRGLAWTAVKPHMLAYSNVQILLIGEGGPEDLGKAVEPSSKDQKHDKETPLEEMEKLEHEDELRVDHLRGDDTVFDDLGISKKSYPDVPSTW